MIESWAEKCVHLEDAGGPSGEDFSEWVKTEDDSRILTNLIGRCKIQLKSPLSLKFWSLGETPESNHQEG